MSFDLKLNDRKEAIFTQSGQLHRPEHRACTGRISRISGASGWRLGLVNLGSA